MPEVLGLRELGGGEELEPQPGLATSADSEAVAEGGAVADVRWRRRAAAGVVVLLFLGVAAMLGAGGRGSGRGAGAPAAVGVDQAVEQATQAALDAWARFASTGEVDQLRDTFDRAGPQFARLKAEAPELAARPAGGAPYAFSAEVRGVRAGPDRDEMVVTADVVVSRAGESDQRFGWELVMRRSGGRWRLWTVRAAPSAEGGAP